jgi:hypothetical protein
VADGAVAASWPLIGMADAVPAIMPAPARMAKAVVAILSLSITLLDLFLVLERAAHLIVTCLMCHDTEGSV